MASYKQLQSLKKARRIASNTTKSCQYCSKQIVLFGHKRHEQFCYLNPINIKLCIVCNTPIKNWTPRKRNGIIKQNVTCSYSCSNKHFRSGEQNGNWKQESYRSTCFLHHKKECVICNENYIVEVHHLDGNKNNNHPSNLIPLCPTHHRYWHSRYKKFIEQKVLSYISGWRDLNSHKLLTPNQAGQPDFPTS